jgi:hypothetical protein
LNVFDLRFSVVPRNFHGAESAEVTEMELSDCLMLFCCRPFFSIFECEDVDKKLYKIYSGRERNLSIK